MKSPAGSFGVMVTERNQCAHYRSSRDIVAIKFKCCDTFYACIYCHAELAGHKALVWDKDERQTKAILCGNCHTTLSITDYLDCGNRCPMCQAAFNPGCASHYSLYFEV
jgi:uncharacterized CHY-type Zn-finger protein